MVRLIFISLALVLSCKSQKSNSNTNDDLVLVLEDAYFSVDEPFSSIINDQKSLDDLFSKINKTRKPGLKIPEVDFKTNTLIFFASGKQKGIEKVRLNKKNETEETIIISLKKIKNQSYNNIVSFPFCLYELPRTDKQILFED